MILLLHLAALAHAQLHCNGENLPAKEKRSQSKKDDSSKQGPYRDFKEDSAQAQKALLGSYEEKVIAHADANNGSCRQGFVKNMVDAAARVLTDHMSGHKQ